jgi:hypothetical protein
LGGSGTTAFDGPDGELAPAAFNAVTVNVYETPFLRWFTFALV